MSILTFFWGLLLALNSSPVYATADGWESARVKVGRALPVVAFPYWIYEQWHKDWDWDRSPGYRGRLDGGDVKVALIGDSLSTGFYFNGPMGAAWINRTRRQKNWFLDTDASSGSIDSLFERLARRTGAQATIYARAGAIVEGVNFDNSFYRRVLGDVDDLEDQVDRIVQTTEFPNLILSWLSHNNMSWVNDLEGHPELGIASRLREIPVKVRQEYARQMRRLVQRARQVSHPVVIVVYGLYDWDSFATARDEIAKYRQTHPEAYPYFHYADDTVHCLRKIYRAETSRLKRATEAQLLEMVAEINQELSGDRNLRARVKLFYSDAFARTRLLMEDLHPVDAWHPSAHLHQRFAAEVMQDLESPEGPLEFLKVR